MSVFLEHFFYVYSGKGRLIGKVKRYENINYFFKQN